MWTMLENQYSFVIIALFFKCIDIFLLKEYATAWSQNDCAMILFWFRGFGFLFFVLWDFMSKFRSDQGPQLRDQNLPW